MKKTKWTGRRIFGWVMIVFLFLMLLYVVAGIYTSLFTKQASAQTYTEKVFIGPMLESEHIGYHDGLSCERGAYGWVKKAYSDDSVTVGIFLDDLSLNPSAEKVGESVADQFRPDLPFENKNHGFRWDLPEELRDHVHTLYVYALDENGEPVKKLNRTGRKVYCGEERKVVPEGAMYVQVGTPYAHTFTDGTYTSLYSGPGYTYSKHFSYMIVGEFMEVAEIVLDEDDNIWYRVRKDSEKKSTSKNYLMVWRWWTNKPWYIPASKVVEVYPDVQNPYNPNNVAIVDLAEQEIYVCEGETLVASSSVSTGSRAKPTRPGVFNVYEKSASRLMQGNDPCYIRGKWYSCTYDYFVGYAVYIDGGRNIHCGNWNKKIGLTKYFGTSHGCVNTPCEFARYFYYWADIGTKVIVVLNLGEYTENPCSMPR